jgi:hypothetical protein
MRGLPGVLDQPEIFLAALDLEPGKGLDVLVLAGLGPDEA